MDRWSIGMFWNLSTGDTPPYFHDASIWKINAPCRFIITDIEPRIFPVRLAVFLVIGIVLGGRL
jgi:hypothetical protein